MTVVEHWYLEQYKSSNTIFEIPNTSLTITSEMYSFRLPVFC